MRTGSTRNRSGSARSCSTEEKDPAVEVLAATNLYTTGKLEDADVFFRDLALRMPGSSYVHSYLAKVLEARGDDGAIAEYATAVHLDPTNQDALRSYAGYLLSRQDFRSALPVLRLLVRLTKKPGDVRNLMRALIETGRADEAVAAHALHGADTGEDTGVRGCPGPGRQPPCCGGCCPPDLARDKRSCHASGNTLTPSPGMISPPRLLPMMPTCTGTPTA